MNEENTGQSEDDPGVPSGDQVPGHEQGTPPISADEQKKGQTSQPAPDDDVGVPDDVSSEE